MSAAVTFTRPSSKTRPSLSISCARIDGASGGRPSSRWRTSRLYVAHLQEETRHFLEGRWTIGVYRRAKAGDPREHHQVAVVRVVIGMLMCDEDGTYRRQRNPRHCELPAHAVAAVDYIGSIADDDRLRRGGSEALWRRTPARAEQDHAGAGLNEAEASCHTIASCHTYAPGQRGDKTASGWHGRRQLTRSILRGTAIGFWELKWPTPTTS